MSETVMPTFREFFNEKFYPIRIEGLLDPKTAKSYRESVNWLVRLMGDLRINEIDQLKAAQFVTLLGKQPGKKAEFMKANSIGKHCVNLSSILQLAGPVSKHNKKGFGLLPSPAFFDGPREDHEPPCEDYTFDELQAMYDCADSAKYPRLQDVTPGDYWRTLSVVAWFAGFRITAMTSIEYSMIQRVKEKDERYTYWVNIPAKLSKRRRGKRQYLRREAWEHMENIRRSGRNVILAAGTTGTAKRYLYDELHKLQETAGMPKERRFGFQSFRKGHLTELAAQSLEFEQGIDIACHSASHSSRSITTSHYINGSIQDRLVAAAIDRMQSPCRRKPVSEPIARVEDELTLGEWPDELQQAT